MIFKFKFFPFNEDEMQRPEIYSRQNISTFAELMMSELKHTILYWLFEKYTFCVVYSTPLSVTIIHLLIVYLGHLEFFPSKYLYIIVYD